MNTNITETQLPSEPAVASRDGLDAKSWRCFHCDEVFTDAAKAEDHFGQSICATPICQIDAEQLRDLENQLTSYRNEDTDLHRQIASMETAHQTALMRAEESGYAKGLRDGRALASNAT